MDILMQPGEIEILFKRVLETEPKNILEIGSYKGGSAKVMRSAAPQARLWCIDVSPQFEASDIGGQTIIIQDTSVNGLTNLPFDLKFDFIFIDGDHAKAGVLADLNAVLGHCHYETVILLHDAAYYQVKEAIQEVLDKEQFINMGLLCPGVWAEMENVFWGGIHELRPVIKDKLTLGTRQLAYRPGTFDEMIAGEMATQYQEIDYTQVKTILDIGGHIGFFANMVYSQNPNTEVISVEMAKDNYDLLKQNIEGLPYKAIYGMVYYGGEPVRTIRWKDGNTGSGKVLEITEYVPDDTHEIETSTNRYTVEELALMFSAPLDVLKLDCEGSEFNILKNLKKPCKIPHIIGEYHSSSQAAKELLDTFVKKHKGYKLLAFSDTEGLGFFYLNYALSK